MTSETRKVVIIDDEEDVVEYLEALLDDHGFEVHTAMDSREGMKLVRKIKPHLVCLDVLMPGETGLSLFRKIKQTPELSEIPVIMISGMNYDKDVAASETNDPGQPVPVHYLEKPVKPEAFLDMVKAILG